jgi:mRNA interferase HigB
VSFLPARLAAGDGLLEVKKSHPKASILKGSRAVFNIKANDYRLVSLMDHKAGIVMIRFFGTHEEYDKVNVETV